MGTMIIGLIRLSKIIKKDYKIDEEVKKNPEFGKFKLFFIDLLAGFDEQ